MRATTLARLIERRGALLPTVLATRLTDGAQWLLPDATAPAALTAAAAAVLADGRAKQVALADGIFFLHPHLPPPRLMIIGAVHIAQALVPFAAPCGFSVTVVDPRRSFASDERFPDVEISTEWPDEALRPAFAKALADFKAIGCNMVETQLPDYPYGPVIGTIIDAEAASIFERLIRSGRVDELADEGQIAGLKAALSYSALDYLKAMRIRAQIQSGFRQLFTTVDLLVAPTHFSPPDKSDRPFDETEPKRPERRGVGHGLVQASNLCGLPAITLPCGIVNGLPIALQIVGNAFAENRMLALAREFQRRTEYHKQHPPITAG